MLNKALKLCYEAHNGQVDKGGAPYYLHPIYVAFKVDSEDEKIVALLHDVVEDTEITLDDLRREGFPEKIVEAVDAITRKIDDYEEYVHIVKKNPIAKAVKIADILHNMDTSRLNRELTEKDIKRLEKYRNALIYLLE